MAEFDAKLPKATWRAIPGWSPPAADFVVDDAARQAVISWAGSDGFAAVHNTGGTVETVTDDLLLFLFRAGFKIAPLDDGDWF